MAARVYDPHFMVSRRQRERERGTEERGRRRKGDL